MNPDTTVKTAALVPVGTSNILNKINTLLCHGYREEDKEDQYNCLGNHEQGPFTDQQSWHYVNQNNRLRKGRPCYLSQG